VIVPDFDSAGMKYAEEVKKICIEHDCRSVSIIDLSLFFKDLKTGEDIYDIVTDEKYRGLTFSESASPCDVLDYLITQHRRLLVERNGKVKCNIFETKLRNADMNYVDVVVAAFDNGVRYCENGLWYVFRNGRWCELIEDRFRVELSLAVRDYFDRLIKMSANDADRQLWSKYYDKFGNLATLNKVLTLLKGRSEIFTKVDDWNVGAYDLCVRNGILDLRTRRLRKYTKNDLVTKRCNVVFDENAECPKFLKHISFFIPNEGIRLQLQRDLGVSLVGDVVEEILYNWCGTGANGKTTTARLIKKILGDYCDEVSHNLLVETWKDDKSLEIAQLAHKRLVFCEELGRNHKIDEATLKMLTGGGEKKGRFLYQNPFTFQQTFSIIQISNHRPNVSSSDEGIWRRLRIIPWNIQVDPSERRLQSDVIEELFEEGPGILNWMIDGLHHYFEDKSWVCEDVRNESKFHRELCDPIDAFISDMCVIDGFSKVSRKELYDAYARWAEMQNENILSAKSFAMRLKDRISNLKTSMSNGERFWQGIALRETPVLFDEN
jgi:putative DNA primase/helicase